MAKGDLFSTVLRGFHKEQVSQYLNDLIRKYEREKEGLYKKRRQKSHLPSLFSHCSAVTINPSTLLPDMVYSLSFGMGTSTVSAVAGT